MASAKAQLVTFIMNNFAKLSKQNQKPFVNVNGNVSKLKLNDVKKDVLLKLASKCGFRAQAGGQPVPTINNTYADSAANLAAAAAALRADKREAAATKAAAAASSKRAIEAFGKILPQSGLQSDKYYFMS